MKQVSDTQTFSVEEFNKYWNSLTITNDYIFCKVFQDAELCKEMLEILLDVKIDHLEYPDAQRQIKSSILSKGIRLDVFVQDDERVFDAEIQVALKPDLALRSRYYHSSMDTGLLHKGQYYTELKESYVIFLCMFDPCNRSEPVYHFVTKEKDKNYFLDDKRHTVLYNVKEFAKLQKDERRVFLEYIAKGENNSSFSNKIEKRVQEVKNDEDWRVEFMTLEMVIQEREREAVERAVAVGIAEERADIAHRMLENNAPVEDIMLYTGLSLEEIEALREG